MTERCRPAAVGAGLVGLLGSLALTGCGGGASETNPPETLVIGVTTDQPGLSVRQPDGTYVGFEVDLARTLAEGLGYTGDEVVFEPVVPANRARMLETGNVDMVLATYSIEDERAADLRVVGPYFVAQEDLLVAADDTDIEGPGDLDEDNTLCSVSGSGAAQALEDEYAPEVRLQEFDLLGQCVEALRAGDIDAITADDIVLAGYLQADPEGLRLVGNPFGQREYGVALPPAPEPGEPGEESDESTGQSLDPALVARLLQESFDDGSWAKALSDHLGDSGLPLPSPPTLEPADQPAE